MAALDLSGNKGLGFSEWVAATMDLNVATSGAVARQGRALFDELDHNGDGLIDPAELRAHFGALTPEQERAFQGFYEDLDADGDGKVSRADFEVFWKQL